MSYLSITTLLMAPSVSAFENNIAFEFLMCFLFLFNNVSCFIFTYSRRVLKVQNEGEVGWGGGGSDDPLL